MVRRTSLIWLLVGALLAWASGDLIAQNIQLTDGTIAVKAVLYDSAGVAQSVGGGTQYAEDAVHASGATGNVLLTKRTDAAATSAGTDGDYATLNTDGSGRLWVNCGTGCSGGTQYAEDDAHASGNSGYLIFGVRRDTTPTSSSGTAGDNSAFNVDANGRLYVQAVLYNSSGSELTIASDATHDSAAPTTGPNIMGECDDTATDPVDEGDSGRARIDCSTRAVFTRMADPCTGAKTVYVVDIADGTNTEIANAVASQFFYICAVNLVAAGATTVLLSEDDTDGCGSPTAGLNGGSTGTTTEGQAFAANGGIALGNGTGTVMKTATANRYLCIDQSASVQLSGTITYVSAP